MFKINLLCSLAAALLLLGCASTDAPAHTGTQSPAPEENGIELLRSFRKNDAAGFVAALPAVLRPQFDQSAFEGARRSLTEKLGEPVSFSYLTTQEHPLFTVSLWKVRFERKSSEGKLIRQEALFRVISQINDGKFEVVSFNFL